MAVFSQIKKGQPKKKKKPPPKKNTPKNKNKNKRRAPLLGFAKSLY